MRVLLLTDADVFAGTERHMLDLGVGLSAVGVQPLIGCPANTPLAEHARAAGLQHLPLEKRGMIDRQAVGVMRRLLREGGIDLIHAHNGRTALNAALARTLARRGRVVMTQHFIAPTRTTRQGVKRLVSGVAHRWMSRRIDHCIAISTAVRDAMLQRGDCEPERVTVVHNGLVDVQDAGIAPAPSVRQSLDVPADAPLIVCAARLQPEKDVASLVTAMSRVVQGCPDVHCVIAGRGDEQSALQAQIDALGLSDRVRLLGFRDDVRSIMAAGDVFVLPARAEPFGLVLVEAMALGKPVITTRAGGPLDIVVPGVTGRLVEPGASAELAEAMLALLADATEREAMGARGRQRYEQAFTVDRMARAMAAVYRQCLSGEPTGDALAGVVTEVGR